MKKVSRLFGAVAATFGISVGGALAQDTTQPQPNPPVQDSVETTDETQDAAASGVIQPEGQADRQSQQEGRLHRVEDLIDAKIRNPQGEDLGEVEELVVDVNSGDIRYAVVSYGGFLGLGDKLFAVPLKAMTLKQDEDADAFFVVDINEERLENSEGFDDDNWPNFSDQSFTSSVDRTYGIESNRDAASTQKTSLYKLSTFEGVNVRGEGNVELGEVEWILIDAQQAKVSHLGLNLEDEIQSQANDDALVLVPMNQLRLTTQGDDTFLQASADVEKIRSAPAVSEEEFKNVKAHKELRQKLDSHFGSGSNDARNATDAPANNDVDVEVENE